MIRLRLHLMVMLCAAGSFAQSFHTGSAESPKAGTLFVYPVRFALKDEGMFACLRGLMFDPDFCRALP